jgi:predicted CXXCH cytochrome family protein
VDAGTVVGASAGVITSSNGSAASGANADLISSANGSAASGANADLISSANGSAVSGANADLITSANASTVSGVNADLITSANASAVSGVNADLITSANASAVSGVNADLLTSANASAATGSGARAPAPEAPHFVGSAACSACHTQESTAWRSSHHAQSMQAASADTVLGNFTATAVKGTRVATHFFQRDGKYFVNTEGPDGKGHDFQILYTFGVYPLQQYLARLPDGRLQALGVAWDSRPATQGGQRWFSLYADQHLAPGDPLHWTGRDQNWNFMCADCHSTAVRRNYDLSTNTYNTTWSQIDVACEACHGPGSRHVQRARDPARASSDSGLTVNLRAGRTVQWGFWSASQKIASPHGPLADSVAQSESCFACHARRQALTDTAGPGHALLDDYLPQLIEAGVYRADGQIDSEDFEFGSFVQSKMYGKGVTCTNCHDAHSLKLRAVGNALCTQCHRADYYDQATHHHHAAATTLAAAAPARAASQCISCHMPEKTYMEVHRRRDHSFRIPRPDLTVALGIPNTCNQCHTDRKASWAVAAIAAWTGKTSDTAAHFANGVDSAWAGGHATDLLLATLVKQPAASGMVRASSVALLSTQATPLPAAASDALAAAAVDPDPLVRLGAARGIAALPAAEALRIGADLAGDSLRAVRIEAARTLAGTNDEQTPAPLAKQIQTAVDELIATEQAAAERPESHVNLAQIYSRLGRVNDAEAELRTALKLDVRFLPALVNLADLNRAQGRDAEAEQWLRQAINAAPDAAEPVHSLGLLEVRRGDHEQALALLGKAAQLDPANSRYTYVYAVALAEAGQRQRAISVVAAARRRLPKDANLTELQQQLAASSP